MSAAEEVGDQAPNTTTDENLLEELIFKQDLNEVHLLIDFVTGRADRSLSTLSMPDPGNPAKTLTSGEVIKAIAEMRYPPKGTDAVNARNAAILLVAKDQLSALATPATGLTIAYTRLFIGEEAGVPFWSAFRRRAEPGRNRERHHDIRIDLAQRSFPSLQAHAGKFRRWRDRLALFSLFWLILTALAYWDAGLGRTALERLDQDWKTVVGELNNNPALIRCEAGKTESAERVADLQANDIAFREQFACRKYNYLRVTAQTAGWEVKDVFHCGNMGLAQLAHVWCWNWLLSGSAVNRDTYDNPEPAPGDARQVQARVQATAETVGQKLGQAPADTGTQVSQYAKANVAYWQTATSILSVFTAYILPMMFALLGTLIGAFRAILNRIRANELAPRDLVRMKIGIPTGLVAGIAVGLFLGPSSVPVQGAGGVSGQLTLTASGLGFLAGYASQSFFGFLDNIIRNIFPYGSTANAVPTPRASMPAPKAPA
jgi:hypothetical protein